MFHLLFVGPGTIEVAPNPDLRATVHVTTDGTGLWQLATDGLDKQQVAISSAGGSVMGVRYRTQEFDLQWGARYRVVQKLYGHLHRWEFALLATPYRLELTPQSEPWPWVFDDRIVYPAKTNWVVDLCA